MTTIEKQKVDLCAAMASLNVDGYAGMSVIVTLYDPDGRARLICMSDVPPELKARTNAYIAALGRNLDHA